MALRTFATLLALILCSSISSVGSDQTPPDQCPKTVGPVRTCTPFACIVTPTPGPGKPSLGLVLTGGGAFGAWEAGALEALFCHWQEKFGTEPPINLVVGTSTGALLVPFALLDNKAIHYVADWYQKVTTEDIYQELSASQIFSGQAVNNWGRPKNPCSTRPRFLYAKYAEVLKGLTKAPYDEPDPLLTLTRRWPDRIAVAATVEFARGAPDYVLNSPGDLPPAPAASENDRYCSRFYDGIFASAVPPLIGPPVPMALQGSLSPKSPHYDGGPYQEAPFDLFFKIQHKYQVPITHIIVISSYPFFPGDDCHPAQEKTFPLKPRFMQIAARFDSLLSESAVSDQTRLACFALQLHQTNKPDEVFTRTGLNLPAAFPAARSLTGPKPIRDSEPHADASPSPSPTPDPNTPQIVAAFPCERMGYDPNHFDRKEMAEMRRRGREQARQIFQRAFP